MELYYLISRATIGATLPTERRLRFGGSELISPPDSSGTERRRGPRFPFVAPAEITVTRSGAKLSARTKQLSLYGCYIDLENPPPVGAEIIVKISTETDYFEAHATVVNSEPDRGIGVSFRNVSRHYVPTLQRWLTEALRRATQTGE